MEILWSALIGLGVMWVMASLMLGPEIMTTPTQIAGRSIKRFVWPIFRPAYRVIARFCDKHADTLFKVFLTVWLLAAWVMCSWLVYGVLFS